LLQLSVQPFQEGNFSRGFPLMFVQEAIAILVELLESVNRVPR